MTALSAHNLTAATPAQLRYLLRALSAMTEHELRELVTTIFGMFGPASRTVLLEEVFLINGGVTFNELRGRRP